MILENCGLTNLLLNGKVRYIPWDYPEWMQRDCTPGDYNVWMVPGTIRIEDL